MSYTILLALALSIDTFVLAISIGLSVKGKMNFSPYKYCAIFGIVQAGLFSIGRIFSSIIADSTLLTINLHISSVVFAFLAIKMLIEFFGDSSEETNIDLNSIWKIAILTSIDALIVGITPLSEDVTNIGLFIAIFVATTIAAYIGIEVARNLKKVDIIERYSLLIGAILLSILAVVSF